MPKTGVPSSSAIDAAGRPWGRFVEWAWRSAAIRRARADARPMAAAAQASAARARTLADLAERHLAEAGPWATDAEGTDDAVRVALTLYRDAAREVQRALAEVVPTAAGGASADPRRELDAVRTEVRAGLEEAARRRGDVDPLLAERFVRVGALVAAAALLAWSPRLAWYAVHPDRAPDAQWSTSSTETGYASYGRGFAPPDFKIPVFFHTADEPSPSITFDLARIVDVRAVTVVNRGDCCGDRAVPLVVEISDDSATWREIARRTEGFSRWEVRVAPTSARWVRLRATRATHLHLESVAIR